MKKKIAIVLMLIIIGVTSIGCDKVENSSSQSQIKENNNLQKKIKEDNENTKEMTSVDQSNSKWNGSYYLKNGKGSLNIKIEDNNIAEFSIDGVYSDNEKLNKIEGKFEIKDDKGQFNKVEGGYLTFQIINDSAVEVHEYDSKGTEKFVAAYLRN